MPEKGSVKVTLNIECSLNGKPFQEELERIEAKLRELEEIALVEPVVSTQSSR